LQEFQLRVLLRSHFLRHEEHALDHFRYAPQVEEVVRFGGEGQEDSCCLLVDEDGHLGECLGAPLEEVREISEPPFKDGLKDAEHIVMREWRDVDRGEVPEEALRRRGPQAHRAAEGEVHQLHLLVRFQIVEASVVDCLSEELERRLRSEFFTGRHVKIVNENENSVAWDLGPKDSLLLLLNSALDVLLHVPSS